MRQQIVLFFLVNLLAIALAGFLQADYPYPSSKFLTLTLDDEFRAHANFPSIGQITIPFNLYSNSMYFTSPKCMNCQIYGNGEEKPFVCSNENFCQISQENFEDVDIDSYYSASGDYISMEMMFDDIPAYVYLVMYVKSVNQKPSKVNQPQYQYEQFGFAFDDMNPSQLLLSLKESGYIEDFAYSLYFGKDKQYHMMIGGFDLKLISKQFYNILSYKPKVDSPYSFQSDLLYAQFSVNSEDITDGRKYLVFLDPNIDYFIFPESFLYKFQSAYLKQSIMPDLSYLNLNQPGQWSSLKRSPSLTVRFVVSDSIKQSNFIDVNFPAEEFMVKTNQGYYTPNMVFQNREADNENIIVMGKQIYEKMMYYKYTDNETTIRCLAPLKNVQSNIW